MSESNYGGKRKGAGRKPLDKPNKKMISKRLSLVAIQRLENIAVHNGIDQTEALEKILLKTDKNINLT